MKILLYIDDPDFSKKLENKLKESGHKIVATNEADVAKSMIVQGCFDLALFDTTTSIASVRDIFEFINPRVKNIAKMVAINPKITAEELGKFYQLGCNDHVKTPCYEWEIALKVEQYEKLLSKKSQYHIVLGKNYVFDKTANTLFLGDEAVPMTKKQSKILYKLASNLGMIVDFDSLRESVWENEPVDNATIRAEVNRLKKILQEDFIKNSRGVGYMIDRV